LSGLRHKFQSIDRKIHQAVKRQVLVG
jgi:hypothetical protein